MRNSKRKYVLKKKVIVYAKTEENNSDQKIYEYMARMSDNDRCPSRNFGDSSQLTNWILDSVATCHMTTEASDFIPGSLEVIVHATTAKIAVNKGYMHIWHACLVMTNVLVGILVTVHN